MVQACEERCSGGRGQLKGVAKRQSAACGTGCPCEGRGAPNHCLQCLETADQGSIVSRVHCACRKNKTSVLTPLAPPINPISRRPVVKHIPLVAPRTDRGLSSPSLGTGPDAGERRYQQPSCFKTVTDLKRVSVISTTGVCRRTGPAHLIPCATAAPVTIQGHRACRDS